jgi:hypothetical protein
MIAFVKRENNTSCLFLEYDEHLCLSVYLSNLAFGTDVQPCFVMVVQTWASEETPPMVRVIYK